MNDVIKEISQKDDKKAYAKMKEIIEISKFSNDYYAYLDDFASLLNNENSYIRTRAFILCCYQVRWDNGKINNILPMMLKLFNDPKPITVRKCLEVTKELVIYCPQLNPILLESLNNIDLSCYKESMSSLIKKDIDKLRKLIEEETIQ